MDYETAKEQLMPAMPPEIRAKFGPEEWETMRINTYLMLEKWVTNALELQKSEEDEPIKTMRM